MAIHFSILVWRTPWTEKPVGYSPWGHEEWDTIEQLTHQYTCSTQCSKPWRNSGEGESQVRLSL